MTLFSSGVFFLVKNLLLGYVLSNLYFFFFFLRTDFTEGTEMGQSTEMIALKTIGCVSEV